MKTLLRRWKKNWNNFHGTWHFPNTHLMVFKSRGTSPNRLFLRTKFIRRGSQLETIILPSHKLRDFIPDYSRHLIENQKLLPRFGFGLSEFRFPLFASSAGFPWRKVDISNFADGTVRFWRPCRSDSDAIRSSAQTCYPQEVHRATPTHIVHFAQWRLVDFVCCSIVLDRHR